MIILRFCVNMLYLNNIKTPFDEKHSIVAMFPLKLSYGANLSLNPNLILK